MVAAASQGTQPPYDPKEQPAADVPHAFTRPWCCVHAAETKQWSKVSAVHVHRICEWWTVYVKVQHLVEITKAAQTYASRAGGDCVNHLVCFADGINVLQEALRTV